MRIQNGHELDKYEYEYVFDVTIDTAINGLLDLLENLLNCSFCYEERCAIIHQLTKVRILDLEKLRKDNVHLFVDKRYIYMINDLITRIKELYNLDFSKDEDFFITLVFHIRLLENRVFHEKSKPDELLNIIKRECLFEYELALLFKDISIERLGVDLDEKELIYLASCLAGAIEKVKNDTWSSGISVIIVSHVNHSISWLMKRKLEAFYGSMINVVALNSIYEKHKINTQDANLVLCTVEKEITKRNDVTTIYVSATLNDKDFEKINKFIDKLKEDTVFPCVPKLFFSREKFHSSVELHNKEDILKLLVEDLVKDECVSPEYYDSIIMRDKQSSLAIGEGIVLAYAMHPCKKTGVSVATIKNSVMWGKCKIKVVVALSMAAKDFKLLFKIFKMVYKDFNYDKKLYQVKTFEEFEKYIFE
ncbi:PTS sugar transporter subunit IIA [Clostridium sp. PL3]|uniref:PTS sugar transporter subunit IIA n=1 Tax=Clostridium thailandense TaxID=2794346 RepID=A0A949TXZ5_9CLOT|nr:PTS sugar transporter subunit IIA [Clostridium thailandense]MBV7275651.1 PTS sugar transporter subunit IIA [Clostridium thailandense]